jgi:hypothetical protein
MPKAQNRSHKYFWLDQAKINRAQKALGATQTDTIDRALDLVISEAENGRLAQLANQRFLRSGIQRKDIFGRLEN